MSRFTPSNNDPEINKIVVETLFDKDEIMDMTGEEQPSFDAIIHYDLIEFIDDLFDFLVKYQKMLEEFKDFSIQPSNTYSTLPDDEGNAIRFTVLLRTPATLSQNSDAHKGRKSFSWMLSGTYDDAKNPGYKVLCYIKMYDNTIELVSWSKNYRDALRGADKLEEIVDTYKHIFKAKGLIDLRYLERGKDIYKEVGNNFLYGIPIRLLVRTYKTKLVYEKILETLTIELIKK